MQYIIPTYNYFALLDDPIEFVPPDPPLSHLQDDRVILPGIPRTKVNIPSDSLFDKNVPISSAPHTPTIQGFSDGGCLDQKDMSAGWWIIIDRKIVEAKGELIDYKMASNNVAEYFGLIRCLESTLDRGFDRLAMNMDSLLVVQQVLGNWQCRNPILLELLQYVRSLSDQLVSFSIQHTLREGNSVADSLCNTAFDGFVGSKLEWISTLDLDTALHESTLGMEALSTADLSVQWIEWKGLVMEELKSFGPMIRNALIPDLPDFPVLPSPSITPPKDITPIASDANLRWPYVIDCLALSEMRKLALEGNVPWNEQCYQIAEPTPNQYGIQVIPYPVLDAEFTTLILEGIKWDLPRLIRAWRGQTPTDSRPNKALDFSRIDSSTVGYSERDNLKDLINHGYALHWKEPYVGVRPLPRNHLSAEDNSEIMGAMILKNYKKGRLMVMNAQKVADHVPSFASSPYGCVAKANKPLTLTCRPIHNQSAPSGRSINEGLDASLRPDATWAGASAIADRILEATSLYGAGTLRAMVTDITDAFLNVGLVDRDVQINGGILPHSDIATLATSCVFGNCESPAAFKILNCVPHIHRQSGSIINGINTPFDVRFYVDDGNAIEPNVGSRLVDAEASLRKTIHDVFGPGSIQEEKTSEWSAVFPSLGYFWNLQAGTVSIPEEKLLRVKSEIHRFSGLQSASITEFRSLVGKLRHISTCCKPAGSLMQLLGAGLSSHKVSSGKQQRTITNSMRTELTWWSTFLTPERFHNLPVEWLGKRNNKIDVWVHCYSETNIGVWLIDHKEGSWHFTPWSTSLIVTVLTALQDSLGAHPTPVRMQHTRIIINECSLAKLINQGSSPITQVQHLFKKLGSWQLDNRHRITATTPTWEDSPLLSLSGCHFHPYTNPLLLQISQPQSTERYSCQKLSLGRLPPSPTVRDLPTDAPLDTGFYSAQKSTYPPSGSTSWFLTSRRWSWLGLPSTVESSEITKKVRATNTPHIRIKRQQSSGPTAITETPSLTSPVRHSCSWRPPIVAIRTTRNQCSPVPPKCCSAAILISSTPKAVHSHGASSPSSISSSVEVGSSGLPITHVMDSIKPCVTTASSGTTLSYKTVKVNQYISPSQAKYIKFKLPLITPKPTSRVGVIQSRLDHLAIPFSARSVPPSWPCEPVHPGKPRNQPIPFQVESKLLSSRLSSNVQQKKKASTPIESPDTPFGLDTPQPCLRQDMMSSLSASPVDGPVKLWLDTPASLVGCY